MVKGLKTVIWKLLKSCQTQRIKRLMQDKVRYLKITGWMASREKMGINGWCPRKKTGSNSKCALQSFKEGVLRGGEMCACACDCSVVSNSVTPWTVARQVPLPVGFSRWEYWSGKKIYTTWFLYHSKTCWREDVKKQSISVVNTATNAGSPLT